MAFNVRKYKFRAAIVRGKKARVGLIGQRSISVNGQKVKAGVQRTKPKGTDISSGGSLTVKKASSKRVKR